MVVGKIIGAKQILGWCAENTETRQRLFRVLKCLSLNELVRSIAWFFFQKSSSQWRIQYFLKKMRPTKVGPTYRRIQRVLRTFPLSVQFPSFSRSSWRKKGYYPNFAYCELLHIPGSQMSHGSIFYVGSGVPFYANTLIQGHSKVSCLIILKKLLYLCAQVANKVSVQILPDFDIQERCHQKTRRGVYQ